MFLYLFLTFCKSHGTLSAESILFEALGDISPSENSDYQISSNCTSSFCAVRFRINHPETYYFSTSLFVEQIKPVYVEVEGSDCSFYYLEERVDSYNTKSPF